MALVDTLGQYAVALRHALRRGETVLCDRYLADALLDLELRFLRGERSAAEAEEARALYERLGDAACWELAGRHRARPLVGLALQRRCLASRWRSPGR